MEFKEYSQQHRSETTAPLDLIARRLHDHVSTEAKETQAALAEHGIRDLPAFITFDITLDIPKTTPLTENFFAAEEPIQESLTPADDPIIDTNHMESPIISPEDKNDLHTFTVTSHQQLTDEIRNYYINNALEATKKTLTHKKLSRDRIPQMAQQIITEIAQKKIDAFYDAQKQLLAQQDLSEKDAQDYFTWRINNVNEAVSFFLKKDSENNHALCATNFIDNHFISLFLQERSIENDISDQETPNISPSTQEHSFHTSAHIDAMLDELKNL